MDKQELGLHCLISLVTLDEWRWWQQLLVGASGDELGQSSAQGLAPLGCADSPKDCWRTAHHRTMLLPGSVKATAVCFSLPSPPRLTEGGALHLERLPSQSPSDLDPA